MAADEHTALAVAALTCALTLIVCFMCVELYHLRGPKSEALAGSASERSGAPGRHDRGHPAGLAHGLP